jgi:hypothetical protein
MYPHNTIPALVNSARYHLKDVIVGKIFFMLVRIKVKHMELAIIRKETVGYGGKPPLVFFWSGSKALSFECEA